MEILLSILSAVLLAGMAVAYRRGRTVLFLVLTAAFMSAEGVPVAFYWGYAPQFAIAVLALGIGLPLLGLALYIYDRNWAPFPLHMTYALRLCWVVWSALVVFNLFGAIVGAFFRALWGK